MNSGLNLFDNSPEIEFCSMCGATNGDFWETQTARTIILRLQPRYGDIAQNWIICDECDEGLQGLNSQPCERMGAQTENGINILTRPDNINLLAQIRRATFNDQEAVLKWLLQKFGLESNKKS
jgi:hypothetical protein